jgi:hypothetical protein
LLVGGEGRVVADMEDDFHRFRVELEHDGRRVVRVRGDARRFPWTECRGAATPLRALEGMPLFPSSTAVGDHTNPRANCTHLFDLAGLAVAHAHGGRTRRRYDMEVPDRDRQGRTRARLARDGDPLLDWEIEGTAILGPAPFAGVAMRGAGFLTWTGRELDVELAEAAVALRRACFIAMGRARDLDDAPTAATYMDIAGGSCHSFTPGIAERATRMRGSAHDFTHRPELLLADVDDGAP